MHRSYNTSYKTHTVVTAGNSETEGGWGKVTGYCTAQYHVLLRGNYWPLGPQSWSPDEKFPEPTILVGFLECYLSVGYRLGGRRGKIVDERARSGGGGLKIENREKLWLKVTKCFVLHQRKKLYHHWAPPTRWWSQSQGGAAVRPHDADGWWFRQKPDS